MIKGDRVYVVENYLVEERTAAHLPDKLTAMMSVSLHSFLSVRVRASWFRASYLGSATGAEGPA